ncbi:MFS transporter [Legionella oakridgensis]|uniref:Arabinose efflux permease n=2 Tax=Legionella oakridgensis TaxID=29423 RepID=W0BBJ7_9GAMM|nr:MFS transporter [Legionella oakridgensis]AHE65997.1 arabinose efflux permease [Legionella oakridgensis ATCC 33761 = DSM 21215]ETO94231.1 arabinose efflux permease [Legionella oakridgensis RV-2-2007]KTD43591.1 transporter, major facilitator family [Legionella oakridgensis]STY15925.1 transporter, major facilitator family [Legionella longbeachae]
MKQSWMNSVLPIAAIFSFRMLGLFMLIPVFSVLATQLHDATPTLIGIALGCYGLSQGILQMPFGMLSDYFGRKPVLTAGLILFVLGSLLGAMTDSIYGMIAARILQGMGAIGSVLVALLADLTPDEQRTKAMAVIGATIGFSFSLAMIISPTITLYAGLSGIFYFTALLAVMGLLLLHLVIPTPVKEPFHADSETNLVSFMPVIKNCHLQRLNAGIFFQHFILTSTFFVIPILLQQYILQEKLSEQWHFYLPLMVLSFITMIPFIWFAEKKQKIKVVFLCSVTLIAIAQLLLSFISQYWVGVCIILFIYFLAFNILEASLPSLVSRQANAESKGTAMGIYSSCQFLGIFAGGAAAGFLYQSFGSQGIFLTNSFLSLLWIILASMMKPNVYQITLILKYPDTFKDASFIAEKLRCLTGVLNVTMAYEEKVIYLKINKASYHPGSAEHLMSHL